MASVSAEMTQLAEGGTSLFVMQGARDEVACGLVHIEQQDHARELAVAENPGLAFDLAKTLVESVCRAVLRERSIAYDEAVTCPSYSRRCRIFCRFFRSPRPTQPRFARAWPRR